MFAGPLLSRELLTASRQPKHYLLRAGYVLLIFIMLYTAGQVVFGWQQVRFAGDIARFGHFVFQLLAVVQLTLMSGLSLLFAASVVAQEKDRRTLVILLMTDLSGRELVLGKMLGSLVNIVTILVVAFPAYVLISQLGGISFDQILALELLCLTTALLVGAWATLVAYWREKTFQTLAISTLGVVLYLAVTFALGAIVASPGTAILNPFTTLQAIVSPLSVAGGLTGFAVVGGVAFPAIGAIVLASVAIAKVRIWNPPRVVHAIAEEGEDAVEREPRDVWQTPILWREIRTRAYGRRVLAIKSAYVALALFAFYAAFTADPDLTYLGTLTPVGLAMLGLGLVSVILLNAQAVTAITTERDGQTLELLLVTEVPAKEFITGKLLGALFNAKEMIAAPLLLLAAGLIRGHVGFEAFLYAVVGFLVLCVFSAVLGIHFGVTYGSSRRAIGGSLATMAFLFLGIFVCMLLIVEGRSSFALQFTPFLVFILGGSLGLWAALTHRTPSLALVFASILLPFLTFYALTSFLLGETLGVMLPVAFAYGFTTIAMLVPAVSEYNIALGSGGRE